MTVENTLFYHSANNAAARSIRIIDRDDGRWFIASDIAAAIGSQVEAMLRGLDHQDKAIHELPDIDDHIAVISRRALAAVLLRAGKPARAFRQWLADNLKTTGGAKHTPDRQKPVVRALQACPDAEEPSIAPSAPISLFGRLITATEIAERLGMSRQWFSLHLDELILTRDFPPRVAGLNRWSESAVLAWIRRQQPHPASKRARMRQMPLQPPGKLLSEAEVARRLGGMSPTGFRRHMSRLEAQRGFPREWPGFPHRRAEREIEVWLARQQPRQHRPAPATAAQWAVELDQRASEIAREMEEAQ